MFRRSKKQAVSPTPPPDFEQWEQLFEIYHILPFVLDPDSKYKVEAAGRIRQILEQHPQADAEALNDTLGRLRVFPEQVKGTQVFDHETNWALLCLFSVNRWGYTREAAVRAMHGTPSSTFLPFILHRLLDWVPQVAEAALEWCRKHLEHFEPGQLLAHAPLLEALERSDRPLARESLGLLWGYVFDPFHSEELLLGVKRMHPRARFYFFNHWVKEGKVEPEVARVMQSDSAFQVRLLALKHTDWQSTPELVRSFLTDGNPYVRRATLKQLSEADLASYQEVLEGLLLDRNIWVRILARQRFKTWGEEAFIEHARSALQNAPTPGAILALADWSKKEHAADILPFLKVASVKMRIAVLHGLHRMVGEDVTEHALEALKDPSSKVKRKALMVLTEYRLHPNLLKLRAIYQSGGDRTQQYALKAIAGYSGWSIVGDLLRGCVHSNPLNRTFAIRAFEVWYYYSNLQWVPQKAEDRAYVMAAFEAVEPHLEHLNFRHQVLIRKIPEMFGVESD